MMRKRLALALLLVALLSAAPDGIDLLLDGRPVYTCKSFVQRGGVTYLPLSESARALGLKYSYDPQARIIAFKIPGAATVIDANGAAVAGELVPLAHPPLFAAGDAFLPEEAFTQVLAKAMNREIRLVPHRPPPPPTPLTSPPPPAETSVHRNPVDIVVIDPGHGGDDTGAKGPDGTPEKTVTLAIALRLRDALQKQGLTVFLTRNRDVALKLADRPAVAESVHADLFLSIHANGYKLMSAEGFETFFASLTPTDQAASDLAQWENQEPGAPAVTDPVATDLELILGDMAQAEALADSQRLAEIIQERMAAVMASENRGVKQAPFKVLMASRAPAVLVEVGFITSPREARAITSPQTQQKIVNALAAAVLRYRDQTNIRLGFVPREVK